MNSKQNTSTVTKSSSYVHQGSLPFGITRGDLHTINIAYDKWLERRFPDEAKARGQHKFIFGKKEIN